MIQDKIKSALSANRSLTLAKERLDASLHISFYDGTFKASPELIGYLKASEKDIVHLLDIYGVPIKLPREEFLKELELVYESAMTDYRQAYEDYRRLR